MNYYQRFLGDYARDTRHLSLLCHGAYSLLLDAYYATERPLPQDLDSLCRICGAINATERTAVQTVADLFFQVSGDGLRHNKRADIEIAKAIPRIAAAKANGLRGGKPTGNPVGSDKETQQEPSGKTALHHSSTPTSTPSPAPSPATTKPKVKPVSDTLRAPGRTVPVWEAYSAAYKARHGAEPTRNAKINGMLGRFMDRVPTKEAPAIAAFFVSHNGRLYVNSMHAIDLLLRDAEKLRTEWQTGKVMTSSEAKNAEAGDSVRQQAARVEKLLEKKHDPF